jgi:hypothetical protein
MIRSAWGCTIPCSTASATTSGSPPLLRQSTPPRPTGPKPRAATLSGTEPNSATVPPEGSASTAPATAAAATSPTPSTAAGAVATPAVNAAPSAPTSAAEGRSTTQAVPANPAALANAVEAPSAPIHVSADGYQLTLRPAEADVSVGGASLQMQLVGANAHAAALTPSGTAVTPSAPRTDVTYRDLYPGIDVRYFFNSSQQLEYYLGAKVAH